MSTELPPRPKHYKPGTGPDRYARFCQDWLNVTRTQVLDSILEAFEQHQKVIVQAANGVGKSYSATNAALAGTYCNSNTTTNITSGSYGQLDDTIWKPMKSLHRQSQLPGRTLDNTRELQTSLNEEWYIKCLSPRYPGDLEGRHNKRMLYVIEEADKPGITAEHIDSALSTLTDRDDRILVICNPPEDENNITHELMESPEWHTLQFSSWDSHDCLVDTGELDGEKIGGLADLSKIKDDWREFNSEEWPGIQQAKAWSNPDSPEFRTDLDSRWYRRRAGIIPPQGAEAWRPFSVADVRPAYNRSVRDSSQSPSSVGIDVARSGDNTVMLGLHTQEAVVHYDQQGTNFEIQTPRLTELISAWPSPDIAVDSTPMGANLKDTLDGKFPNVVGFQNQENAIRESEFYDKWTEGLHLIGEWLRDGGSFSHPKLREELLAAARSITFTEKRMTSRGGRVIKASSKDEVKQRLGRSPDYLDALLMAVHTRDTEPAVKISYRRGNKPRSGSIQ